MHPDIEFSQGSIFASRGDLGGEVKKLNIKSGKTSVSIDKGDVKLTQGKAKDLNLLVSKGNANIDTAKGTKKVDTNQRAVIAKDSQDVMLFKLSIKLQSPSSNSYLLTVLKKKKVDFSWQDVKGEHIVFLEISRDNSFDNIIIDFLCIVRK